MTGRTPGPRAGFSLVELLVVLAIIGSLAGLLLPALGRARNKGLQAQCASNLRQLQVANLLYADDTGAYVPAADDIMGANRRRWHGTRSNGSEPFDGRAGPLAGYLGSGGSVRSCPAFRRYDRTLAANAFEASCGGYGYNDRGVGSSAYVFGYNQRGAASAMAPDDIRDPCGTVMFADTAFPQPYGNNPTYLIEYSFAEAYYFVSPSAPQESPYAASPSVHFRHNERANVVWCDGHVSSESLTTPGAAGFSKFQVGWFGPADNSLWDPF